MNSKYKVVFNLSIGDINADLACPLRLQTAGVQREEQEEQEYKEEEERH